MKHLLVLTVICLLFTSCFQNLFKVHTSTAWSKAHIDSIRQSGKQVIVHFRNETRTMPLPSYDSTKISGELTSYHKIDKREDNPSYPGRVNAYKKKNSTIVFGQVHVYVAEDYTGQSSFHINKENFAWSNVYEHDRKATTINHVISVGLIGAYLALNVVAIATMSFEIGLFSMPF